MRIGFYAPLKAPDHPVPSGDRQVARLLIEALRHAGHTVEVISTFRSFLSAPEPAAAAARAEGARAEVDRIASTWTRDGSAPDLLFAYHPYYKAPDLVAMTLAARFDRPYATAEASHAPKRAAGPWAEDHAATERALRSAAVHFCFTGNDWRSLSAVVDATRLVDLPPFIDASRFTTRTAPRRAEKRIDLATVAMMRSGAKAASYALLASALGRLRDRPWRLTVAGDGPARPAIERVFAELPADRIVWRGQLDAEAVADLLRGADLFAWPGLNEAFGLSYLEAQACGVPVVAVTGEGTPSVIHHGRTGLLTAASPVDYADALDRLMRDDDLRDRLGAEAARFVHGERTVAKAAAVLDAGLRGAAAA